MSLKVVILYKFCLETAKWMVPYFGGGGSYIMLEHSNNSVLHFHKDGRLARNTEKNIMVKIVAAETSIS